MRGLELKLTLRPKSPALMSLMGLSRLDRQWFQAQSSGLLQGTITVHAEDGVTPLAAGSVNLSAGKAYQLVLGGG
jgi:hypothetical protein